MGTIYLIHTVGVAIFLAALMSSMFTGRNRIRQLYIVQALSMFVGLFAVYFVFVAYQKHDLIMASLEIVLVVANTFNVFILFRVRRRMLLAKGMLAESLSNYEPKS